MCSNRTSHLYVRFEHPRTVCSNRTSVLPRKAMSGSGTRTVCSNRTWFELSHFHVRFEHPHYVLEPEVLKPDMAMSGLSTQCQIHVRFELGWAFNALLSVCLSRLFHVYM